MIAVLVACYVVHLTVIMAKNVGAAEARSSAKHLWVSLLFLCTYISYPGASIAISSVFPCDFIEGKRYLKADYR